jgi:hypothetical protein
MRLNVLRAVLAAAGILVVSGQRAHADPNVFTATLNITGSVNAFVQVFVENVAGNTGFDLTTAVIGQQIATVRERSNRRSGYKVMVSSGNLNAGNCTISTKACFYSATTGESLALDIFKGASTAALALSANPTTNSGNWTSSSTKTTGTGVSNAVRVAFDGAVASLGDAPDYAETLTFTIAANP